jgi:serine/threonine protein kinase
MSSRICGDFRLIECLRLFALLVATTLEFFDMSPFDVFQSALELSTHEEQDAFVIETCLGNDDLQAEVLSLLEAHRHVGDFLESRNLTGSISQAMTHSGNGNDRSLRLAVSIARLKKLLAPSPDPEAWGMLNHFSVLGVVDAGGYGLVVRARDETLRRTVAIKLLDPTCQLASESQSQFLKEAQSAAQINHENVVRIHSVHSDPIPFIVMEYVHGTTLTSYLRDHSTFPIPVLINLSHQIASGLAAAHECGLVHRDVKPGNILVELKDKDFPRIKLADFGLALGIEESTSPSDSSDFIGTPSFAAPEQARSLEIGPRADLFSLGSVLYFMATGLAPFRANSTAALLGQILHLQPRPIREIRPEVPQWFCDLVEQLHQKAPEKRPQNALEVVRWIADWNCDRRFLGILYRCFHVASDHPYSRSTLLMGLGESDKPLNGRREKKRRTGPQDSQQPQNRFT